MGNGENRPPTETTSSPERAVPDTEGQQSRTPSGDSAANARLASPRSNDAHQIMAPQPTTGGAQTPMKPAALDGIFFCRFGRRISVRGYRFAQRCRRHSLSLSRVDELYRCRAGTWCVRHDGDLSME